METYRVCTNLRTLHMQKAKRDKEDDRKRGQKGTENTKTQKKIVMKQTDGCKISS